MGEMKKVFTVMAVVALLGFAGSIGAEALEAKFVGQVARQGAHHGPLGKNYTSLRYSGIKRPASICQSISKHIPSECRVSSDCFHIDCEFQLLNYSFEANLDLYPCGKPEAYVT